MSDLYPTPTRIQLLRDVEARLVFEDGADTVLFDSSAGFPPKVTSRIREMQKAGWVHLPDGSVRWRLTDAGREILRGVS